jgi:hypothetical protein
MSVETVEKIVSLIDQRRLQVLEANGLSKSPENENNMQYLWIMGIYDDIIECIRSC